jgi:hypothetical protein
MGGVIVRCAEVTPSFLYKLYKTQSFKTKVKFLGLILLQQQITIF